MSSTYMKLMVGKTGDYYVDKDTGKVYLYTEDNKITEY